MPAEVIWRSPRCKTSEFPIESLLINAPRSLSICTSGNETWSLEYALLEFSIHNVREDFEFSVGMGSESRSGFDPVLVNHAQVTKARVIMISVSLAR